MLTPQILDSASQFAQQGPAQQTTLPAVGSTADLENINSQRLQQAPSVPAINPTLPDNAQSPAAPAPEKYGLLKRLLTNFVYNGSQALKASQGLPTDFEIQQKNVQMQHVQAQTQLVQQQAAQMAQMVTLPNGVMMPYGIAVKAYPAYFQQQGRVEVQGMKNDNATTVQGMKGQNALDVAAANNQTKQNIADQNNDTKRDIAADQLKWKTYALGNANNWKAQQLDIARQKLDYSINGPTGNIKTQGQMAGELLDHIPNIQKEITDLGAQGKLGPLAGRYNEFMAGKVGDGDPQYTALRTDLGLFQTALMKAHVGARGSEMIMKHFQDLIDSGKASPAQLQASLGVIKGYLQTYKNGARYQGGGSNAPAAADPLGIRQ